MESKLSSQEKILFFKSVLKSIHQQIDIVNQGLILDSGEIKPEIVDSAELRELEARARECETKIAELENRM